MTMSVVQWNVSKASHPSYATKKYEDQLFEGVGDWPDTSVSRFFRRESDWLGSTPIAWFLDYRVGDVDIVHATFQTIAPAAFVHSPDTFVVTVHDLAPLVYPVLQNDISTRLQWSLTPSALRRADSIIAISEFTRDELLRLTDVSPDSIDVVYQGVDHSAYRPVDTASAKERLGLDPSISYVLVVASNLPHKRMDLAADVFAEIRKRTDDVRLLKAGYGQGLEGEGVVSVGWLPEKRMPLLYNSADVYVHASEYEGFGLPVLEAMACGVPVVANRRASVPEVVGEENTIDMEELSPATIAEHVLQGVDKGRDDGAIRRSEQFSWDRTVAETRDVYRRVREA